ncbi:hypothetical protein [Fodinicola feengrottensis]|uniref:Uncharacterized protein n=1 Tax=Fodinicola feengrottensis TaxID=435914 RepID=A0ABN2INI4_9ACTN|nr:hypothetical protein [Fodinicola feengrottensis]
MPERTQTAELIRSELARALSSDPQTAHQRLAALMATLDDEGRQVLLEMFNSTSALVDT